MFDNNSDLQSLSLAFSSPECWSTGAKPLLREQSKRKLAMEKVFVAIFLTLILLVAKLRLSFKIVQARTDFNVFNFSLALCLTVSGSRFKEAPREQLKKDIH